MTAVPRPTFIYRARAVRVIDGDSIVLDIDVGFSTYVRRSCRLAGVDTPEIRRGSPRHRYFGRKAMAFVMGWVRAGVGAQVEMRPLVVHSTELGKFGRPLVMVWRQNDKEERTLNAILIAEGLGRPYDGGRRPDWSDLDDDARGRDDAAASRGEQSGDD